MLSFNTILRWTVLSAALEVLPLAISAQSVNDSPFSAYGFGDLVTSPQVSQALMGGAGVALVDPFSVIAVNPASYSSLRKATFEVGARATFLDFRTSTARGSRQNFSLLGLTIGIPFASGRSGLALGLMPVSEVGYSVTERKSLGDGLGDVRLEYSGTGGLNRAFAGVGHNVWQRYDSLGNGNRLSIGANFNYVFGGVERSRKAYYPQGQGYYNTSAFSDLIIRDPVINAGFQLQGDITKRVAKLEDTWHYLIGGSVEASADLRASSSQLVSSFIVGATGVEFTRDTVLYQEGVEGNVSMPLSFGIGGSIYNSHWMLTAEMRRRDWAALRVNVEGYDLKEQLGVATAYVVGASFRPADDRGGNFLERTIYRAGIRYETDYLTYLGSPLRKIGTTFGFSLPIYNSSTGSRFNFGVEMVERGTEDRNILRERYIGFQIGLTVTPNFREPWFKKRQIQ